MRDLSRGDDYSPAAFTVCIADKVFDVAVLHRLGLVPALYSGETRLLYCLFDVSGVDLCMSQDIVREFLVQLRSPVLNGLLGIEHERKFLVLYALFENPQRLCRGYFVFRYDSADIVTVEQRMLRHDETVRNILMVRIC
jgi:hypothetical protein